VADEKDLWKRIGLTPSKAVLIGVLAVTLVGVLYIQYWPDGAAEEVANVETTIEPPPPPPRQPRKAVAASTADATVAAPAGERREMTSPTLQPERWEAPDVETIVGYDPFALPPSFPQSARVAGAQGLTSEGIIATDAATRASQLADAVARLQTELDSLRQRGVSVIVRERDKYVAMIGDRTVHVGDEINGFTVTAIEPDGVRVEKKVTE
jgi:hypothetical protein